ncbi:MAG: P-II family nitrogen regulator [Rhodothermales bacterium]
MKQIQAYIKPHKLSSVTRAFHRIEGLTGVSVSDVKGFGRGRAKDVAHSFREDLVDYVAYVKIETVVQDELVYEVIQVIQREAHTGLRGDGKIYVSPIHDAVRISSGERGTDAI